MKCLPLLLVFLVSCQSRPGPSGNKATPSLTDTTFTFLWREMQYDEEHKDSFSAITIDTNLSVSLPEPIKAAITYVAYHIGSECIWDGQANKDRSNLKCKVPTALGLGYQCSEKQQHLLKKWVINDTVTGQNLRGCSTIPWGASHETTFDSIAVQVHQDSIIIFSVIYGTNMPSGILFDYKQTDLFLFQHDRIKLLNSSTSDFHKSTFSLNPDEEE